MNPPVFAALNVPAVRSFVGAGSPRIFQDAAPQNTAKPYIVWQIVGGSPLNNLSDNPEMDDNRVRVWCYTQSVSGVMTAASRNLGIAVRTALEAVTHVTFGPISEAEPESELSVWIMDAEFFDAR